MDGKPKKRACLATLPELGCGVIKTIDRSGISGSVLDKSDLNSK